VLDGVVSLFGERNPVLSGFFGSSVSLVGENLAGEGFLSDNLVMSDILGSLSVKLEEGDFLELVGGDLSKGNSSLLVSEVDGFVSDFGGVARLSGMVVELKGELFSVVLGLDSKVVLLLVELSEVLGVLGGSLSFEESFLGLDGTGDGLSDVILSISLHSSLDLDLGGIHSLGNLAGSDGVLSSDNRSGDLGDLDLGFSILTYCL